MTTGTEATATTTVKQATANHPLTWSAVILAIVSTVYTSYLEGQKSKVVTPTPVPPIVNPVNPVNSVTPVTPTDQTKPVIPVTPPAPSPNDKTTPISSGVTIADMHGQPLGNSVDPGQMFTITAAAGVTLTAFPSPVKDADIAEFSDSKLVCTLRNGCTLQIVVTSNGVKPSVVMVQCNQAPQPPPPVPVVNPVTPPAPINPTPVVDPNKVATGVRVVVLRDAMKALSKGQVAAVDSPAVTDLLNAKCAKDSSGRPAWHRWEKDVDVSGLPEWQKLINTVRSKIDSDNLSLPLLVIESGNVLHLYEITDEAAMIGTLNAAFAGGAK